MKNPCFNTIEKELVVAKDPAILFYTSDFLTGTMLMTNEQVGVYIRLLCLIHQQGGLIDKESFNDFVGIHNIVRKKFIETEGGFINKRLTEEMDKRKAYSKSRSENRKKHMFDICSTHVEHMENEIENENVNTKEKEKRKTNNKVLKNNKVYVDINVLMAQGVNEKTEIFHKLAGKYTEHDLVEAWGHVQWHKERAALVKS